MPRTPNKDPHGQDDDHDEVAGAKIAQRLQHGRAITLYLPPVINIDQPAEPKLVQARTITAPI
jgi:hypothetical protein